MAITGNTATGFAIAGSAVETVSGSENYISSASKTIEFGSGTAGNPTTLTNNGLISNSAFGTLTVGSLAATYGKIINNGRISSRNTAIALSDDAFITNNGVISSSTNSSYTIIGGRNSTISNTASGTITTAADYAIKFSSGGSFSNSGLIQGGVDIFSLTGETSSFGNYGTINGDVWENAGRIIMTLGGGKIGSISTNAGNDWINVSGAISIGAVNGGADSDDFSIHAGAGNTMTMRGAVTNFETFALNSGIVDTGGYGIQSTQITTASGTTLKGGGGLTGAVTLSAGSTLVAGATMPYAVTGTLSLNGALQLVEGGETGQQITLISNDGSDTTTGTFSNVTPDTDIVIGKYIYQISYNGGSGSNDVILKVIYAPPPPPPDNSATATTTNSAGQTYSAVYSDHADSLGLGDANDLIYGMGGADLIQGNNGNDTLFGNWDNDTLTGNGGSDFLYGGKQEDLLFGDDNSDMLSGNRENDTLNGGNGNDTLYGGQENDLLFGNDDNDILWGDLGNDTLSGGAGADRFEFAARSGQDIITDFSGVAGDRISLNGQTIVQTNNSDNGAVLSLSGGGTVLLRGIAAADIDNGWFL